MTKWIVLELDKSYLPDNIVVQVFVVHAEDRAKATLKANQMVDEGNNFRLIMEESIADRKRPTLLPRE